MTRVDSPQHITLPDALPMEQTSVLSQFCLTGFELPELPIDSFADSIVRRRQHVSVDTESKRRIGVPQVLGQVLDRHTTRQSDAGEVVAKLVCALLAIGEVLTPASCVPDRLRKDPGRGATSGGALLSGAPALSSIAATSTTCRRSGRASPTPSSWNCTTSAATVQRAGTRRRRSAT